MGRRVCASLLLLLLTGGCGGETEAAPRAPSAATPAAMAPAPPAPPPPPPAPPVDLLRSVATELAVSSAYRDQGAQAARLVDGDLETSWNSRSGELVGAWIEVRLPASATVTGIALTVGFTRTAESDLFAGNHRISAIRVLHDGVEVASPRLDAESRELQQVAVEGGGGVWRIEVTEVVPGTRASWREVCVSELRVMGRDPSAREGTRFPRVAIGRLPDPRPEPGAQDRAQVATRFESELRWFVSAWERFERDMRTRDTNSDEVELEREEIAGLTRSHRSILTRVADLADRVDGARADALRAMAATEPSWAAMEPRRDAVRAALDAAVAAFASVAEWLATDEARCRWARAHVGLRLERIAHEMEYRRWANDMASFYDEDSLTREDRRNMAAQERMIDLAPDLDDDWPRNPRGTAARIRATTFPDGTDAKPDWDAIRAQLDAAPASCGW